MGTVRKMFSFDEEDDAALLAWLESQDNASATVRAALRSYRDDSTPGGPSIADVMDAVKSIDRKLKAGAFVGNPQTAGTAEAEDPALAAALDGLGL